MVTMGVMSIVATAVMGVAMSVLRTSINVTDRRDVLTDGKYALDQMTKDLRQAESIDASSTSMLVKVPTYRDGASVTVVWRATGTAAPYKLERSSNGGTTYVPVLETLASKTLFTYTSHDDIEDQVTISIQLTTRTGSVPLTTDVLLRNAE
jgi:hypothetical protein